jgi:hypothetical protein
MINIYIYMYNCNCVADSLGCRVSVNYKV